MVFDSHARQELRIFSKFIKVAALPVKDESIEKRNFPEPDILCEIDKIGKVAFELVQLIDSDFAKRTNLMYKSKSLIHSYFKKLPKDKRNQFKVKYGNSLLFFDFNINASLNKRERKLEFLFDYLLSHDFSSDNEMYFDAKDGEVIRSIWISSGQFIGPIFDVRSGGSLDDPLKESINNKLTKNYITKFPIELLAYYDMHPIFPEDIWLPTFAEYVSMAVKKSNFRRIWIYDIHGKSIRYKYP